MNERVSGVVERKRIAEGSKSERDAVVLVTISEQLILRRKGGNAFQDSALDALVGRSVELEGTQHNGTFIFEKVTIL